MPRVNRLPPVIARASCLLVVLTSGAAWAAEPELVNIRAVDPTILVELRYATPRNIARRPLYAPGMPALVRPEIAARLSKAQSYLQARGYGLKIWDAYRPKSAHAQLWQLSPNTDYVAKPQEGGSLHTWGVAVDATMVDAKGHEVKMPTDFDDFTPAAMLIYAGADTKVRRNLRMLQSAMARANFYGMRTEWWHFVAKDWKSYRAVDDITLRAPAATPAPALAPAPVQASGTTTGRSLSRR